jgi:hypothetical protein
MITSASGIANFSWAVTLAAVFSIEVRVRLKSISAGSKGEKMESIVIYPVALDDGSQRFHAVAGDVHSEGDTAGQALDGFLDERESRVTATVVILPQFGPDKFFSAAQHARREQLMAKLRAKPETGIDLSASERAELEYLVDAEVRAAAARSAEMLKDLGK